jgi:chorismate mutase / prephenate dehydratase
MMPEEQLHTYRASIDTVDAQLIALIKQRTEIIAKVAALKASHWPNTCHIRPGREGQMHRAIFNAFAGSSFPQASAVALWRLLISASTDLESPLRVAHTAATAMDARDYFSPLVQYVATTSAQTVLNALENGNATIAVVPSAEADPDFWNAWLDDARSADYKIFAYMPVVLSPETSPRALAVAKLTPEPSGDDWSYFYDGTTLHVLQGFITQHAGAQFLGAHAAPLIHS